MRNRVNMSWMAGSFDPPLSRAEAIAAVRYLLDQRRLRKSRRLLRAQAARQAVEVDVCAMRRGFSDAQAALDSMRGTLSATAGVTAVGVPWVTRGPDESQG